MQAKRHVLKALAELASPEACLFSTDDLRALLPNHSVLAFKTLLSRIVETGELKRVCRGLYLYELAQPNPAEVLPRAVQKIRPLSFNYLSLESVLSDAGVISQLPLQRLMVMSSARSAVIDCGQWGSIEFIKTRQKPEELVGQLVFDPQMQLWRANVAQALRDMRATHRSMDLIDWREAHDFV